MKTYLEVKKEFSQLLSESITNVEKLGYATQTRTLENLKERFDKKELMIVTVGEMRRGKSSLLTALVEEKDIFPIDVNVCTNAVTVVRYGNTEKIEVVVEEFYESGSSQFKSIPVSRSSIKDYVSEKFNKDNNKNVRCVNVEIPNEKLKSGLVFVDTPGVGSLNISHAEITYGFLPDADVLLFVSDASAPLTDTELIFLETAYKHCKNIIFPITKIDKEADYNTIIEENKQKINEKIGLAKEKILMIPVSSLAKIRYLDSKNEDSYTSSNFKTLEKVIWETIANKRAQIIIMPFLSKMVEETGKIKSDINIKYQALCQDKETADKISEKLSEEIKKRKSLQDNGATWRSFINLCINQLSFKSNDKLIEAQQEIADRLNAEFSIVGLANPKVSKKQIDKFLAYANSRLVECVFDIRQMILDDSDELYLKVYNELELNIDFDRALLDGVDFVPADKILLPKPNLKASDKAMVVGRSWTFGGMGGGAVGGIAGGIIGGLLGVLGGPGGVIAGAYYGAQLGAAGGALLGSTKGLFDAKRVIEGMSVQDVKQAFSGYITKSITKMKSSVTKVIQELNHNISTSFQSQLSERIDMSTQASLEIQENAKLSKQAMADKKEELKKQAAILNNIEVKMVSIGKEVKGIVE